MLHSGSLYCTHCLQGGSSYTAVRAALSECRNILNLSMASQVMHVLFFITKPTRCTNFTNLFCHETLHVSDSSSVHRQEFINCTLVDSCRTGPGWNCSSILVLLETCMPYTIAECTVNKHLTMDRGSFRNMKSFMTK